MGHVSLPPAGLASYMIRLSLHSFSPQQESCHWRKACRDLERPSIEDIFRRPMKDSAPQPTQK